MSKGVTPKSENYSRWYTDVITKAELADYGPVKGTMIIRPYGFQIWENIKNIFDSEFKKTGHTNAYFPLFIPKSFLNKEADHVDGFAKECAIVTHSRLKSNDKGKLVPDPDSKLEEEVIVRPTSETIIWSMYKKWIKSHRDLPILINQWANVVRWEMRTRLFLRTSEFLWQEGHTAHATQSEAVDETLKILNIYQSVIENYMGIPVITGRKSENEKFAGAEDTYTMEAMMGDKKALQAGTSHYLGTNFSKAFDVKFQDTDNKEKYVYATSWGVSTRLLGALIMVHGDDKGLRLPPNIAPIQVVIIPIYKTDEDLKKIKDYIMPISNELKEKNIPIYFDSRDSISPGFKFNEWEMKGVPLRIEVGLRDINDRKVMVARRDTLEKITFTHDSAAIDILSCLTDIQKSLFDQALNFRNQNIHTTTDYNQFKKIISETGGFIKCFWDGKSETENLIKKETNATIRCIINDVDDSNAKCVYSGALAKHEVIFSKAY
jgi:prolyl-tRNA synthetase|tara:strand:+ start:3887 stop:5359 length:1473 start_codon:yes stop_codon:yes gene_type:complete